jgi:hypothetical protein
MDHSVAYLDEVSWGLEKKVYFLIVEWIIV